MRFITQLSGFPKKGFKRASLSGFWPIITALVSLRAFYGERPGVSGTLLIIYTVVIITLSLSYIVLILYSLNSTIKYFRKSYFPQVDIFNELFSSYEINIATDKDIPWIAKLEKKHYSHRHRIPEETLNNWFRANKNCFTLILKKTDDENLDNRIGYVTLLPLKQDTLNDIINGKKTSKDIQFDGILSFNKKEYITSIFVESITLDHEDRDSNGVILRFILSNIYKIFSNICNYKLSTKIYILPSDTNKQESLRCCGFRSCGDASTRKDRLPLYELVAPELLYFLKNYSVYIRGINEGLEKLAELCRQNEEESLRIPSEMFLS